MAIGGGVRAGLGPVKNSQDVKNSVRVNIHAVGERWGEVGGSCAENHTTTRG